MKITYNKDNITIYILKNNYEENIKDYVKRKILKLKNESNKYISGFYKAKVYTNKIYGIVIELIKEDGFDFFKDFIKLDIEIIENCKMYFKFNDYFLPINKNNIMYYNKNYYIDLNKLSKQDFYKLLEHSTLIYGKKLKQIKKHFNKLKNIV